MSSVGMNSKSLNSIFKEELESLLRVSLKELLDLKVSQRPLGGKKISRQIARILTRLNCI